MQDGFSLLRESKDDQSLKRGAEEALRSLKHGDGTLDAEAAAVIMDCLQRVRCVSIGLNHFWWNAVRFQVYCDY